MRADADRVSEIFASALERAPGERGRFLDEACAGSSELRHEVERLLAAHDGAGRFLDSPIESPALGEGARPLFAPRHRGDGAGSDRDAPGPRARSESGSSWLVGRTIGGCRVEKRLAVGGMGIVFEAEQGAPRRRVALKVVHPALASPELRSRLSLEARTLARLKHPCIAGVFGAGSERVDGDEIAYIVMEFVDGRPLDRAAHDAHLDLRARMTLVAEVADAVQHAHDRGVIHRDLKPSNVLVDAAGVPHVLDFGIARLVDVESARTLAPTAPGSIVGTIRYMSPEQLAGSNADLDTRCDVYALGVMAYELASGRLPFDAPSDSAALMMRAIDEGTRIPLRRAAPACDREIEAVILKAIERDRADRYASARDFADDLRRWAAGEPVAAATPGVWRRARHFVRRHRGLVASVLAVIAALAAGLVLYANEARRASAAARTSAATTTFLTRLLARIDPNRGSAVDIRALVRDARGEIAATFGEGTLEAAAVHDELGTIFYNLRLFDEAEQEYALAIETRGRLLGPGAEPTLDSVNARAQTLAHLQRPDEAEPLYRRALAGRRALLGEDHPKTLIVRNNLAALLEGRDDRAGAEEELRSVLAAQRRTIGARHEATLITMGNLASLLRRAQRFDESHALRAESYEGMAALHGPDHAMTAIAESALAQALSDLKRFDESDRRFRSARDAMANTLGPDHRDTAIVENNWGVMLVAADRDADAIEHFETARRIYLSLSGADHRSTISITERLVSALQKARGPSASLALRRELVGQCERGFGKVHARTVDAQLALAEALRSTGDAAESRRIAEAVQSTCEGPGELLTPDRKARIDQLLGKAGTAPND